MSIVPFSLLGGQNFTDDSARLASGEGGEFAAFMSQYSGGDKSANRTDGAAEAAFSGLFTQSGQNNPSISPEGFTASGASVGVDVKPAKLPIETFVSPAPIYKDSAANAAQGGDISGWRTAPLTEGQANTAGTTNKASGNVVRSGEAQQVSNLTDKGARPAIANGRVPTELAESPAYQQKPAGPSTTATTSLMGMQKGVAETVEPLKAGVNASEQVAATRIGGATSNAQPSSPASNSTNQVISGQSAQSENSSSSGQGQNQQGQPGPQAQGTENAAAPSTNAAAGELLPGEFVETMEQAEADATSDVEMMDASRAALRTDSAQPAHVRASGAAQSAAVLAQVSQRLIQKMDGKTSRFEIRLDPAELGKVDVRIEVDRDGRVQAVLAAKESVAADALTRGLRSLENALTQAGFELGDKGVQVELEQNNSKKSFTHGGDASEQTDMQQAQSDHEQPQTEVRTVTPQIQAWSRQRLDLTA